MSADVQDTSKKSISSNRGVKLVQYQRNKSSAENKESNMVEEVKKAENIKKALSFAKALSKKLDSQQTADPNASPNPNPAPASTSTSAAASAPSAASGSSGGDLKSQDPNDAKQSSSEAQKNFDSNTPLQHPLQNAWTFWYMHREPGQKILDYEAATIKIASFSTVEEFWNVYTHLRRPNDMPTVLDFHLFKLGVRPVWEDESNIEGGKWMIRIKKGLASRLWERLVLAVVGNQFEVEGEVCGAVLSIRNSEDIISLWNKTANDASINISIRDTIKTILGISNDTIMEYKAHNDSLRDNSSFRNTDVYKS